MNDADDLDAVVDDPVEDQIAADRQIPQTRCDVLARRPKPGVLTEERAAVFEYGEDPQGGPQVVLRNAIADPGEVRLGPACEPAARSAFSVAPFLFASAS